MNTNNPKLVRREEGDLPAMVTIDGEYDCYYLVLREDDHLILKSRIEELEGFKGELNNYKEACKSLGEEVARLRGASDKEAETQDGKPEDGFNLERNTLSGKGYYYLSLDDSNMYDKLKSSGDPKDRLVCRMIIDKAKAICADYCGMTR